MNGKEWAASKQFDWEHGYPQRYVDNHIETFDAGVIEGKRQNQETIDKLKGYAQHDDNCAVNLYGIGKCTCGFHELIVKIETDHEP